MAKLSANELIAEAKKTRNRSATWVDGLSSEDRKTLNDLVQLLVDNPDVSVVDVAKMLPDRFGVKRSKNTIRKTLGEMMNHVKAKS